MMARIFLLLLALLYPGSLGGQSVLPNGDFEQPDPTNPQRPSHWELLDGLGVQWTEAPSLPGAAGHGKAIRMNTALSEIEMDASWTKAGITDFLIPHPDKTAIAETYGLSLYSDPIPLESGKAYRISFDYLAEKGTSGKVWFRCYEDHLGKLRRRYEGVLDCSSNGQWRHFSEVYHPFIHAPNVTIGKIMLYGFYPAGVFWYDNITVEVVP